MKKILFTFFSVFSISFSYAITYYYVGGPGPNGFTTNSNWNTALNGSGTIRVLADVTDILIFDGSNISGAVPSTGTVTMTMTSNTIGAVSMMTVFRKLKLPCHQPYHEEHTGYW